jgi:hypothetical protein
MQVSIPPDASHPHSTRCFKARLYSASVSQKKSLVFSGATTQGRSPQAAHPPTAAFSSAAAPHPHPIPGCSCAPSLAAPRPYSWLLHGPRLHPPRPSRKGRHGCLGRPTSAPPSTSHVGRKRRPASGSGCTLDR